jgi:ABC-type transport system involved in multi-copper enzyme maturation permease subunit
MPWWQTITGLVLLLGAAGCLLIPWLLRLLGPVFFFDLVRTTRQGRSFFLRCAYPLVLLVMILLTLAARPGKDLFVDLFSTLLVPQNELAAFASSFFTTYLKVQFGAVFLLTPVLTATAITEEKQRRTLECLLASDLHNREIVLGKLASRFLTLILILLNGLPVLSFLQLLGGVDPNLVLAGFACTVATMLSLGSLGILLSIRVSRPGSAIVGTFILGAVYSLGAGNILLAFFRLFRGMSGGVTGARIWFVAGSYVLLQGMIALVFAWWASVMLRKWVGEEVSIPKSKILPKTRKRIRQTTSLFGPPTPPQEKNPILWKELYFEGNSPLLSYFRRFFELASYFWTAMALVIFSTVFLALLIDNNPRQYELANGLVRIFATPVACLMLVVIALKASISIGSERDRRTLDNLLATPLDNRTILWGKFLGSLLIQRQGWYCLVLIWFMGLITGGLHPLSMFLLIMVCGIHAVFAASLGLWFSLRCRTTLRATLWTILTLLVGSVILWDTEMTFPLLLVDLTFPFGELTYDPFVALSVSVFSIGFYGGATAALWSLLLARFGPITGRMGISSRRLPPKVPSAFGEK